MSPEIFEFNEVISEYLWKIDKNSFLNKEIEEHIFTPVFTINNLNGIRSQWKLLIFPSGKNDTVKDYVSFVVVNKDNNPVTAIFTISILNQYNLKINLLTMEKLFVPNKDTEHICLIDKLVLKSFITDEDNKIFKGNKLIFSCKINAVKNNINLTDNKIKVAVPRLKEFDNFKNLLNNEKFSDVTVIVDDGSKIKLHKNILTVRSDVFAEMFECSNQDNQLKIIEINNVSYKVLYEFFRFIYTGKVIGMNNLNCDLLPLAEQYNVKGLKLLCEESMFNNLKHENALHFLKLAIFYNIERLKMNVIEWIALHFDRFISNSEFKEFGILQPKIFYEIVKKNHLISNTSID